MGFGEMRTQVSSAFFRIGKKLPDKNPCGKVNDFHDFSRYQMMVLAVLTAWETHICNSYFVFRVGWLVSLGFG